jgi:Thrombospondin type 3 repeat
MPKPECAIELSPGFQELPKKDVGMPKLLLVLCLLASLGAHAEVVYDNGTPADTYREDIYWENESADSFVLSSTSTIGSIGFYASQNNNGPNWDFGVTYNIYADSEGAPGELLATGKSVSLAVNDSRFSGSYGPAKLITFNLGETLVLSPGQYWLGLTDVKAYSDTQGFHYGRWIASTDWGAGFAYSRRSSSENWLHSTVSLDLAFYVDSEPTFTPELSTYEFGFVGSEDNFSGGGTFTLSKREGPPQGLEGLEAFEYEGVCAGYPCSFSFADLINDGYAGWSIDEESGEFVSLYIGLDFYPVDADMRWNLRFFITGEPGDEIFLSCLKLSDRQDPGPCNGSWWDYRAEGYPGPEVFFNTLEDTDFDGDGILDDVDNCPMDANPQQENADGADDGGDACDSDDDNDGLYDVEDNCHATANEDQANTDGADDGGDACDNDDDNDNVDDSFDNCPLVPNALQEDYDTDTHGDVCDNCVIVANPDQADIDENGVGDLCENIGC